MVGQIGTFDIAVQPIAGRNLKFTNFLSRNPEGGGAIEDKNHEEYVITILTEHAALNAKYSSLFDSQSNARIEETEKERKQNRNENENFHKQIEHSTTKTT